MSESTKYKAGTWYQICDQSGFKVRATKTKKQWNGYVVRKQSWEARHPQDLVRGVADYQAVPEARPRPSEVYVKLPIILTSSGVFSNYGVPLYNNNGGLIYRAEGLGANEVDVVTPDKYPNSW